MVFETFPLSMSDSISQYFLDAVAQCITNLTNFTFISPILGYKIRHCQRPFKIKIKNQDLCYRFPSINSYPC